MIDALEMQKRGSAIFKQLQAQGEKVNFLPPTHDAWHTEIKGA